ncbi:hypothetical protein Q3G72_024359 [Acer saccharum]|nr:hypothetical protein Q3G72_024359 [Acer saccharum]
MEVSHLTFFSEHYWMPVAVRAVSTEPREGLPKISQVAYKDKWIFVVSTSKNLYAGVFKIGTFHHSSFLAGGATLAAGRLEAEQGILKITGQQMTCLAAFFLFSRKMESTLMKLKLKLRLLNLKFLYYTGLQHLAFLKTLEINCCNKLQCLPEEGLPSSLTSLCINECSLLKPKLQKRKGKDWYNIAHIPRIQIDEQIIS